MCSRSERHDHGQRVGSVHVGLLLLMCVLGPSGMITGNVSGPCMSGFYYVTALPRTNLFLMVIENWKQYKNSFFYNFNCKIAQRQVGAGNDDDYDDDDRPNDNGGEYDDDTTTVIMTTMATGHVDDNRYGSDDADYFRTGGWGLLRLCDDNNVDTRVHVF